MDFFTLKFDGFIKKLQKVNAWKIIVLLVMTIQVIAMITSMLFTLRNPIENIKLSFAEKLFILSILAPIIETLLFQTLIINCTIKLTGNKLFAVLISGLTFGLVHYYSLAYMLFATTMGVFFGVLYIVRMNRNPTIYVIISHSLYNLFSIFIYDTLSNHFVNN